MEEQLPLTSNLVGMGKWALQAGDVRRAAQLLGAAGAALKVLNAVMEPFILDIQAFLGDKRCVKIPSGPYLPSQLSCLTVHHPAMAVPED